MVIVDDRLVADAYYKECNVPWPEDAKLPPKWLGAPPGDPSSKHGADKVRFPTDSEGQWSHLLFRAS